MDNSNPRKAETMSTSSTGPFSDWDETRIKAAKSDRVAAATGVVIAFLILWALTLIAGVFLYAVVGAALKALGFTLVQYGILLAVTGVGAAGILALSMGRRS